MQMIRLFLLVQLLFLWSCAPSDTQSSTDSTVDSDPKHDINAPTWPEDAALVFVKIEEDSLVVQWTEARDDVGVTSYVVRRVIGEQETVIATIDGSNLAVQISQLEAGTTISLTVQARDAAGNISTDGPSGSTQLKDERAPTWPEDSVVTVSDVNTSSATLSWPTAQEDLDVARYRLYQNNIEVADLSAGTTTYTAQDLDPWKLYEFRVEAEDALQNLSNDGPKTSVRTSDDSPPTWPGFAQLDALPRGEDRITLGWDNAVDDVIITGYRVRQDDAQIAILPKEKTWLNVNGLSPGSSYTFDVFAVDAGGNESVTALTITVSTLDETRPLWAEPAWLQGTDGTDTSLSLGWSDATDNVGITGYHVFQNNLLIESVDATITSTTIHNLIPQVTYIFRVEAEDALGNLSQGGPTLLVDLSDQTPPWWPEGASCSNSEPSATSVSLSWTSAQDNTGVTGYLIVANDVEVGQTNGDTQSLELTGLDALTEYTFQVFAVDGTGNTSVYGPEISVTTPDYPIPSWPPGSTVNLEASGPTWVILNWAPVPQTDAVSALVLFQDNEEALTLDALATSTTLSQLSPLTSYDLRVEARGPTGLISDDGPTITISTPDYSPPAWSAGATLTASDVTETSLVLTWAGALDVATVSTFSITQNDNLLSTVFAPESSFPVVWLSPGTSYTFVVEATGPTGLVSTTGPSTTVLTQDNTAPLWLESADVTIDSTGPTWATLSWTPASDNVAIMGYDVLLQGALAQSLDGQTTNVTLTGLTPATFYQVEILGFDAASNQTADALEISFTTSSTPSGLTTEEIYNGLTPHCDLCHKTENTPFFDSLANFESMIVENDEYVIPGDPDASLLIKVLEGNGSPPWIQMPLSGNSFQQLSNQGKTNITMAEIRTWVLNLEVE